MKFYQTFRSVHITIWKVCLIVRKNCESFEIAAENEKLQQKKGMKSIEKKWNSCKEDSSASYQPSCYR